MDREFQRRNNENMRQLFDLILRDCGKLPAKEEFEREAPADTDDREQYDELPGH